MFLTKMNFMNYTIYILPCIVLYIDADQTAFLCPNLLVILILDFNTTEDTSMINNENSANQCVVIVILPSHQNSKRTEEDLTMK